MSEAAVGLCILGQCLCSIGVEKASLGSDSNPRRPALSTMSGSLMIFTSTATLQSINLFRQFLLLRWLGFRAICHDDGGCSCCCYHSFFIHCSVILLIDPCTDLNWFFRGGREKIHGLTIFIHCVSFTYCLWIFFVLKFKGFNSGFQFLEPFWWIGLTSLCIWSGSLSGWEYHTFLCSFLSFFTEISILFPLY